MTLQTNHVLGIIFLSFLSPLPFLNSMSSYFSVTQKNILLTFLAVWAFLNVLRVLRPSSLPCDVVVRGRDLRGRDEPSSWMWAQQSSVPQVRPCLNFSDAYRRSSPAGGGPRQMVRKYMMVVVNGGLNQQRQQIIDAVVVARIIGATLVLPVLQVNQVWGDDSEFADIFDDRHFKKVLKDDVTIVSSLPASHLNKRQTRGEPMPFRADEKWVRENYQSKLGKDSILILRGFDSRLTKDLHVDLQKLRCKTAFEALKFQPEIEEMASRLVKRIGLEGPYMALHLRLEKDVWLHTGCPSGLGREADRKIDHERASNPRLLTARYKLTARDRYVAGMCPLNANEISRMLKGLGAPNSTRIYWAGGVPFGGQKALKPLRTRFPNLHNKWSLTSKSELDGIRNKPSILAALDYIVCLKSKSFIASHGGNMANSLQDHRIYMGYGMPIVPKKKPLVHLFMNKSLHEDEIDREIKHIQSGYLNSNEKTSSELLTRLECGEYGIVVAEAAVRRVFMKAAQERERKTTSLHCKGLQRKGKKW